MKIKAKEQYNAEKESTPKRKGKGIHKSFFSSWEEITHTQKSDALQPNFWGKRDRESRGRRVM